MDKMDLIRFVAIIIITNEAYHVFCPKERYFFEPRLLSGFPFLLWTVTSRGLTAGRGKYLPQSNPHPSIRERRWTWSIIRPIPSLFQRVRLREFFLPSLSFPPRRCFNPQGLHFGGSVLLPASNIALLPPVKPGTTLRISSKSAVSCE